MFDYISWWHFVLLGMIIANLLLLLLPNTSRATIITINQNQQYLDQNQNTKNIHNNNGNRTF